MGRPRVRFTGRTEADAEAVLAAAAAHDACLSGAPADWEIPAGCAA
ncbi:hypothetical protein EV384_2032 [Micromonospora kangleipakensis]|uniref:Uncharacterized protein n=1 Tax=Micromonospora kangleipakensis TaxID=1077942 RepID=A0A4Q8B7I1_9ACTN|nr:hypothetical protein [Micromonospora kangleipakensis]RZU73617.1 hypothetical protein EV384_2032 [Micromonospora kangleipakensis]